MKTEAWVGIDIGGTKTAVLTSHQLPDVEGRCEFPTEPDNGYESTLRRIIVEVRRLLRDAGASRLRGIGVRCGGPLDRVAGIIQSPPNLKKWAKVPITSILGNEFGAPCRLENDANAGAIAEFRYGAGRGTENMVFITMGTGFGAGVILNGRLYRGRTDAAGELGHIRLTPTGPIGYGKAGSIEGWASGQGLAKVAEEMVRGAMKRKERTSLAASPLETLQVDAKSVFAAALASDPVALRIIQQCGERLGEALAIVVDMLNPERIVIGGLATRMGRLLLDPALQVESREALAGSVEACSVVTAALGEQIGDVAALCVAEGSI